MKITGLALLTRQDINSYTLLTTYYTLLVTYYTLLTTYYTLLVTYYTLLTTYYTLLVTYYLATQVFSYRFFVKFDDKIN